MEESFLDQQHRKICLIETETMLQAYCGERPVGRLEVCEVTAEEQLGFSPLVYFLENIWVRADYRRAGIGFELLASGHEIFYPLHLPENGSPDYLALLAYAKRKGLLLETWPQEHDVIARLRKHRGRIDW